MKMADVDFDSDFDNFIREQDAKNTTRGNMNAWRCLSKYSTLLPHI